nr:hypothetical protein [Candidatus Wallbacteria bacterium]
LKRFCIDLSPPVVRDIQVYYDKEGIRLDEDKSMFVENDQSPEGTLSVALVGHTLTLWAFCTDEITADPRKFKDAKFYVRKHGSTDPWFEIDATCEVDTDILYQDIKFAFQKTPPKHPNNYLWFAFYTIPYNADLTSYDVDFQVADALGNRSAKLSESADEDLAKLTKKQFSVATLGFKNVTVPPKSNSSVLNVAWQSFEDWRKCDSVSHYIVSIGDLTPNPFETSNWVDGSLRSCTREVRIEGKVPVFVMPVEKITTVGFGSDYSDAIYSFEEPKSVVNFKDGWRESEESGGYFSADVKKIKSGMYSWSNFMNNTPGKYRIYKDFNIESGIKVTFGAWVKKETGTWTTSKTKLQVICYNDSNTVINPSGADNDVTFENEYDNVSSDAWVHYYLNVNDQKFFETPPGTSRIRLQLTCDSGSKVYIDQLGFASYAETEVDFTPPQKPVVSIGVFNHHNNTYDSATVFGYWDGAWDIKGSAWFDEPANFPTLLSSNLVSLSPTTDNKKVGLYSYKVSNSSSDASVGYFQNADIKLDVEAGDLLRIWANFESKGSGETKRSIDGFAIAFSDGTSWSTKVFYGNSPDRLNNAFVAKGLGGAADGMNKLGEMGDSNTWLPLDINISDIGMEGRQISGLAFAISAT